MNNLKNSVNLIGRLGVDPEIRKFNNGKQLARFPIATSEIYRNGDGEKKEDTQWHQIVAWGKQAELVEDLLAKGKRVAVDGKLMNRSYETKDGDKRYTTEINMRGFLLLEQKKK